MQNKFLLVTGATGQIGSAVVRMGLAAGYRVRIVARSPELAEAMFAGKPIDIIKGNLLEPRVFRKILPDVTHLCHCAARVGDWGPPREYWDTNVHATKNLLNEIGTSGTNLEKIVHISSLGVYEPRDHYGTTEDVSLFKNGLDAYNQSKAESEELILNYKYKNPVKVIVLRPGFVYGPGDRHVLPGVISALKKGIFVHIGNGENKLDQISVINVAEAVRLALAVSVTKDRVFNITDGELVSRKEFVNTIADHLKIARPTKSIPKLVGRLLAIACDRIGRTIGLKNPPLLSKARYKFLALNLEYSIARAQQQLGYVPQVSFADGMRSALDWYTEAGEV